MSLQQCCNEDEHELLCMFRGSTVAQRTVFARRLEATYLTIWTVVQTPFWPICPGRRGLSGGGPTSLEGYWLARSSHSPLKCWMPAGERQVGGVQPKVGPPPWALPLLSPSGNGHLCCSLQQMINKRQSLVWLRRSMHYFRVKTLLHSQNGGYCSKFEDTIKPVKEKPVQKATALQKNWKVLLSLLEKYSFISTFTQLRQSSFPFEKWS